LIVATVAAFENEEVDSLADKDGRNLARKVLRTAGGVDMKDPLGTMKSLGITDLIEGSDNATAAEVYSQAGGDAE
jgi:hypothetical protein